MNPIYIEYGIHQNEDCYKIDLPWTDYRKKTIILCPVKDGVELAITLAKGVIMDHAHEQMRISIS